MFESTLEYVRHLQLELQINSNEEHVPDVTPQIPLNNSLNLPVAPRIYFSDDPACFQKIISLHHHLAYLHRNDVEYFQWLLDCQHFIVCGCFKQALNCLENGFFSSTVDPELMAVHFQLLNVAGLTFK